MRGRMGWIVAALFAAVAVTGAQGWSMTVWFQQTIAVQNARLELMQAAQTEDPMLRGYLDVALQETLPTNEPALHLQGWAFECIGGIGDKDVYAVDLRLNAFRKDVTSYVTRYPRADIPQDAGLSSWCPVFIPADTGLDMVVPIGQLLPGWYTVALEFWTSDGRSLKTNGIWMQIQ